jgi:hypothetical protein
MFRELSKTVEVNIDPKGNITLRKLDNEALEFKYFFMTLSEAKKLSEVIQNEEKNRN